MRWNLFKTWKLRRGIRAEVREKCLGLTREELDEVIEQVRTNNRVCQHVCRVCSARKLELGCWIFHKRSTIDILASELVLLRKRAKTDEQKYGSMPI